MLTELKKKMYSVKTFGCDVLGKKAEKITVFDDKLAELAADMVEIMNHFDGIGLAAPQIGVVYADVRHGADSAHHCQRSPSAGLEKAKRKEIGR